MNTAIENFMRFVEQEANKDPTLRKKVDEILSDDEVIVSQEKFNNISPLAMAKMIIESLPANERAEIEKQLEDNSNLKMNIASDYTRFSADMAKVRQMEETNQIVAAKAERGEFGPEV